MAEYQTKHADGKSADVEILQFMDKSSGAAVPASRLLVPERAIMAEGLGGGEDKLSATGLGDTNLSASRTPLRPCAILRAFFLASRYRSRARSLSCSLPA